MSWWKAGGVALLIPVLSALGTMAAPAIGELVKGDSPPPLSRTCQEIEGDYAKAIAQSPADRERILPGADGVSTLADDPQAQYCKLTPEKFK